MHPLPHSLPSRQIDDLLAYHQGKAKEAELAAELDRTSAAQGNVSCLQLAPM